MMNEYRIVEVTSGGTIAVKKHGADTSAQRWLHGLLDRGIIAGVPVQLQRRTMTDGQAALLPPFANGQAQTPWRTIG